MMMNALPPFEEYKHVQSRAVGCDPPEAENNLKAVSTGTTSFEMERGQNIGTVQL